MQASRTAQRLRVARYGEQTEVTVGEALHDTFVFIVQGDTGVVQGQPGASVGYQ